MRIELRIDRLVLEGIDLPDGQQTALRESVVAELSRLFTEGGSAPGLVAGGAMGSAGRTGIEILSRTGPAEFGRRIAAAIYGDPSLEALQSHGLNSTGGWPG